LLQFNSSNELWLKLVNTGSDELVYAGEETPLGIDYRIYLDSGWLDNENWLGRALMSVREKLDKHSVTVLSLNNYLHVHSTLCCDED